MRKDKKTAAKPAAVSNEVSNVTPVASVNCSCSADMNMLVEFIIQQHEHSGNLYEASEFMDVSRLYQAKSRGAVNNVVFNGDNIAIEGAISISFSVAGMNQSELREQIIWALQTVVERNKQLVERANDSTKHMESVAENKAEVGREVKNATKVKPFRGKVNEKAVERFNEAVSKGVDALEPTLKGLSPSASGQKIRCFLYNAAHDSHLKLPDTSGVTLVKNLTPNNVELMHALCATANCKVPPFLQMKTAIVSSSSKSVTRA